MASDAKRFFLCTWYQPIHDLGKRRLHSQIHKVRDGLVSVYISALLTECGYSFGGALLNVPSGIRSLPTVRDSPFAERSDDVVWISTRLPLHEAPQPPADDSRKRRLRIIDRSESPLEKRILASFEPYFETCCRTRIALSRSLSE